MARRGTDSSARGNARVRPQVAARIGALILQVAARGIDVNTRARDAGFDPALSTDPEARMPRDVEDGLRNLAAERGGEPRFGRRRAGPPVRGRAHRSGGVPCAMLRAMNSATPAAIAANASIYPSAPARGAARRALRLLLVDDCRVNRMLVTAVLTRWGIVPTIACDGAQAVLITERQDFDIVLMDILMPVMDGVVATAKIRQAERENPSRAQVPIVAYTSLDLGADPVRLARVGLSAILPKPCSATSLQTCLARWCPDKFVVN